MISLSDSILNNPDNANVLAFLGIQKAGDHNLISNAEKGLYTHEGLETFLGIKVPSESKFLLDGKGIVVMPDTGSIIAFQFGQYETAFKIHDPHRFRKNYLHIKLGLIRHLKIRSSFKVSLGYFSNVYADPDSIIDIRALGSDWALSIYLVGQTQDLVQAYYYERLNKQSR